MLLFPVPATPRYNQYQAVFFNFVLLKKNWPGNEAKIGCGFFIMVRYVYFYAKSFVEILEGAYY